jgi:hypothetical protein
MGDQAPNTTTDIMLTVRVAPTVQDTVVVQNGVALTGINVATQSALAASLQMIVTASYSLALVERADVVEAGMGESVPYTLIIQNTGTAPLGTLRVHAQLLVGARYARNSAIGADSGARPGGRDTIRPRLCARATVTIRYAVATPRAESVAHEQRVRQRRESVLSPRVTASVNVAPRCRWSAPAFGMGGHGWRWPTGRQQARCRRRDIWTTTATSRPPTRMDATRSRIFAPVVTPSASIVRRSQRASAGAGAAERAGSWCVREWLDHAISTSGSSRRGTTRWLAP